MIDGTSLSWTADELLNQLSDQALIWCARQRAVADDSAAYSEYLKQKLRQALGSFPEQSEHLNAALLGSRDYGEFRIEQVQYSTAEGIIVPAMVLIPKQSEGPWPAVLACHGHGSGMRDAAGLSPDGELLEDPGIHNRFAIELVRRGLLVIIPEILGFGARRLKQEIESDPCGDRTSCNTLAAHLLAYGKTLAGYRVFEAMRAIDYLNSRSDVIGDRIGVMGFSGGGLIASIAAAMDERLRAAVLCGYTNTFQGSILAMHHCIDNYLPGILMHAEQPDLIGLIAPRPLFIESGIEDPLFPVAYVREAIKRISETYHDMKAGANFQTELFTGGHQISGRVSIDWLASQL
jgi:dienelactone hydrolase